MSLSSSSVTVLRGERRGVLRRAGMDVSLACLGVLSVLAGCFLVRLPGMVCVVVVVGGCGSRGRVRGRCRCRGRS